MSKINRFACILNCHSIDYTIESGQLLVNDVWDEDGNTYQQWRDASNWSEVDLLNWLGY